MDLNKNIKPALAAILVVLGYGYFFMCSIRDIKPDPQILIAVVAGVSATTGYYFGSSSGSSKKDDTISDAMVNPVVNNAQNVNVK